MPAFDRAFEESCCLKFTGLLTNEDLDAIGRRQRVVQARPIIVATLTEPYALLDIVVP